MFRKLKLNTKLMISFLVVGLLPFAIISITTLIQSNKALENNSKNQLRSIMEVKKNQISQYFTTSKNDLGVLVENVNTIREQAIQKLETVQELKHHEIEGFFNGVRRDARMLAQNKAVQDIYRELKVYHDKHNIGPTDPFDVATRDYEDLYNQYGAYLANFADNAGYNDAYVICAAHGHVMYTSARESDLGENLANGSLKEEGLARLWAKVKSSETVRIEDFSAYSPIGGAQAAFVGAPMEVNGALRAIVALEIPTEPINDIIQQRNGLGETGETYLVAKTPDERIQFRSNMLTMGDGQYVVGYDLTSIAPEYIYSALKGEEVAEVFTDSNGDLVLVDAHGLNITDCEWGMVTKVNFEEVIAPKRAGEQKDFYAKYIEKYGYYDLFLIHPEGRVFYTVTHEADYQTNMVNGKYADSNLGVLVREMIETQSFGFADFKPYAPSNGAPESFIGQPVLHAGDIELIVALQMPLNAINGIMTQREGLGETGETYLVGSDFLMRSDSYLDPENHSVVASFKNPGKGSVKTEAVTRALQGESGVHLITDYNGNSVLSSYAPLSVWDTQWAILAEVDEVEAFAAIKNLQWIIGILAVIGATGIVLIGLFLGRSISNPIRKISFKLRDGADQVTAASDQVSEGSQKLAEGASEQAASVEESSASLEEMAAMTQQNASNAKEANTLADATYQAATDGTSQMEQMQEVIKQVDNSSDETAKIIKTIDEIAFQTNLLALNAAVEAARAGEAGQGFAVVADEVRNLAQNAAEAARETGELIEKSRTHSKESVEMVESVSAVFEDITTKAQKVNELVGEINAASDEQSQGIDQVNIAVGQVDQVTQQVASNAEESAGASEELNAQAKSLLDSVDELNGIIEGRKKDARGSDLHQNSPYGKADTEGQSNGTQLEQVSGKEWSKDMLSSDDYTEYQEEKQSKKTEINDF